MIIESCITSKYVTKKSEGQVSLVMAHTTASSIYSAAEDVPLILAPQFSALKSVSFKHFTFEHFTFAMILRKSYNEFLNNSIR